MSSMVLDGASPRSRATDPVTSVDAGRKANVEGSRDAVLSFLRTGGEWTLEDIEIAFRSDRWSPSRIRSAVSELEAAGLVEVVPDRFGVSEYGRRCRLHRAVKP